MGPRDWLHAPDVSKDHWQPQTCQVVSLIHGVLPTSSHSTNGGQGSAICCPVTLWEMTEGDLGREECLGSCLTPVGSPSIQEWSSACSSHDISVQCCTKVSCELCPAQRTVEPGQVEAICEVQGNEDLREASRLAGTGSSSSVAAATSDLQAVQVVPDADGREASSHGQSQPWTTPHDLLVRIVTFCRPLLHCLLPCRVE